MATDTTTPSQSAKAIVYLILIFAIGALGVFVTKSVFANRKRDPMLNRFEGIKRMQEMRLVQHHYQEIIPFKNKNGNLQFLIVTPADIYGKIDMSEIAYELGEDSLLKVTMPRASVSDVWIELDSAREYKIKGNPMTIYFQGGKRKYSEAFNQIIGDLSKAKQEVVQSAVKNGILEDTQFKAREYITNLALSLGYRIEFTQPQDSTSFQDKLNHSLDQALDEYLNPRNPDERDKRVKKVKKLLDVK
ncbi:MAG: DUF4230 domain-containing protein [Bacteroidia bacterium]|nr:DUF4230 domain-containing protein [Bacteroidia bacterium]